MGGLKCGQIISVKVREQPGVAGEREGGRC